MGAIAALALGLLAVFLFAAFAVVAIVLAVVGLARLWWMQSRGSGRPRPSEGILVEYQVAPEPVRHPVELPPTHRRDR